MLLINLLILCSVYVKGGLYEGDPCLIDEVAGKCTRLINCPAALQAIKDKKHAQVCYFNKTEPIVCCIGSIRPSLDLSDDKKEDCPPLPAFVTAQPTGQKAWDKCIEYQNQLIYPCEKTVSLSGKNKRNTYCYSYPEELILPDKYIRKNDYSHMALLGYGKEISSLEWLCGGALISKEFILTAAHCTLSKVYGPVTFAALNSLDRGDIDHKNIHSIVKIINHPDFSYTKIYHDIALLQLTPITLNHVTVPACLHTGEMVNGRVISTTWNTHDVLKTNSTRLERITLSKYTEDECGKSYPNSRRGQFNESTHLCFGDKSQSTHICEDDGGSPVVVKHKQIYCMYTIVGITSLGKGCLSHHPGLYTKVENYLPWIESIVWP